MSSFFQRRVDLLTLDHLILRRKQFEKSGETESAQLISEAVSKLSKAFGLRSESKSDRYALGFDATLQEICLAGTAQVGVDSASSAASSTIPDPILSHPKFAMYLQVVKEKGG